MQLAMSWYDKHTYFLSIEVLEKVTLVLNDLYVQDTSVWLDGSRQDGMELKQCLQVSEKEVIFCICFLSASENG